jgi:hypothetical protein
MARRRFEYRPGDINRLRELGRKFDRAVKKFPKGGVDLARKLIERDQKVFFEPRIEPLPTTIIPSEAYGPSPIRWTPTPSFNTTPTQVMSVPTMDPMKALQTVINDPAIKMDKELLDLVNDDNIVLLDSGELAQRFGTSRSSVNLGPRIEEKKKPRDSKYTRIYKREFRRLKPRYMTKNGKWKKNGFKDCVRAAHRATRKILG